MNLLEFLRDFICSLLNFFSAPPLCITRSFCVVSPLLPIGRSLGPGIGDYGTDTVTFTEASSPGKCVRRTVFLCQG